MKFIVGKIEGVASHWYKDGKVLADFKSPAADQAGSVIFVTAE